MIPTFRKIRSSDQNLMAVQDNAFALSRFVGSVPLLNGLLIEDVVIASGTPKVVDHKLGRKLRGYIVVRQSASASVYDSESETPDRTLILNASGSCTVSLWVF